MILVISKRREFVYHFVPFQIALSTGTLAPLLGCLHSKVPVREFERWVDGGSCTQCFLCRDGTFQDETTVEFIISCESIHELGSFLYQFIVLLNHFVRRIGTVNKLGQINEMRLLPDQERTYIGRCFRTAGIGHLHPAHTGKPLATGYFTGNGFYGFIPTQRTVQQISMPPKRLPGLMPPNHFEMELTEPGIISQTCLLRRYTTGRLDSEKILAEYHTTFQLLCTRIGAM